MSECFHNIRFPVREINLDYPPIPEAATPSHIAEAIQILANTADCQTDEGVAAAIEHATKMLRSCPDYYLWLTHTNHWREQFDAQ